MKKFERAFVPDSDLASTLADMMRAWVRGHTAIRASFPCADAALARDRIWHFLKEQQQRTVWKNDVYQVQVMPQGEWTALSIKRIDREPIHDWRELQEIKNQLLGREVEAVELYPADSRVVDTANQYYLWSCQQLPKFPFGFDDGRHVTDVSIGKSKNRKL